MKGTLLLLVGFIKRESAIALSARVTGSILPEYLHNEESNNFRFYNTIHVNNTTSVHIVSYCPVNIC